MLFETFDKEAAKETFFPLVSTLVIMFSTKFCFYFFFINLLLITLLTILIIAYMIKTIMITTNLIFKELSQLL